MAMGSAASIPLCATATAVLIAAAIVWLPLPIPPNSIPPSASYSTAMTAEQKLNDTWKKIHEDTSGSRWNWLVQHLFTLFTESMHPTFDHIGDTLPNGRVKAIHSVGVVAKGALVAEESSEYTGEFAGSQTVLLRLSTAKPQSTRGIVPGVSMKFFRTGMRSATLLAIRGLNSQQGCDFFSSNLSNHFQSEQGLVATAVNAKARTASVFPTMDIASYDRRGDHIAAPKFPYQVILVPPAGLHTDSACDIPFENELGKLKPGSIYLTSELVRSTWADRHLFFQHQRMEDDIQIRPEWDSTTIASTECLAD